TPRLFASNTSPVSAGTIQWPAARFRPAMTHCAPRTPGAVTAALVLRTISWVAESIFTIRVSDRSESVSVRVAIGRPVPASEPIVQLDGVIPDPMGLMASTVAKCPLLGLVRYDSPVSELVNPTRSAPEKVATALPDVTVSVVPLATNEPIAVVPLV